MKGDGIRQKVTASGKGATAKRDPRLDAAVAAYRRYVQEQADETLPKARSSPTRSRRGDIEAAKKAYAVSRIGWERTEPVAESFGDIDPKVDVREDGLEEARKWTGWHTLEQSLWEDKKLSADDTELADRLISDLKDWQKRVGKAEITPTSMANGAKELLDEVATGKVTGEEERYSHTDLVDFQANVEGAREGVRAAEAGRGEERRGAGQGAGQAVRGDEHAAGRLPRDKAHGFASYDTVGKAESKELSDGVNALAEPLSKLAAAVARK